MLFIHHQTCRIPHEMKMSTLSPQNATVSSPLSVPSGAIKLTLITFNFQHYNEFLPFLPPTLINVVMKQYDGEPLVEFLPPTLTQLITEFLLSLLK